MSGRSTKHRDDRNPKDGNKSGSNPWGRDRHCEKESEKRSSSSHRQKENDRGDAGPNTERDRNRQRLDRDRSRNDTDCDPEHRRRPRERDEKSSTGGDSGSIQGPVVLLRRPPPGGPAATSTTTVPSTSSSSSSQSVRTLEKKDILDRKEDGNGKEVKVKAQSARLEKCPSSSSVGPGPIVLQRPSKKSSKSSDKQSKDSQKKSAEIVNIEKPKLSAEELARKLLEPFCFPEEFAIPVIDNKLKIRPADTFNFFLNRGKRTGDYFVIAILGRPLTGKSTILSYLANNPRNERKLQIFSDRSPINEMESFMYITEENVIFIEMSSIFSCDAAFDLALQQGTLENTSMTWNLKLMRWALAISHVVLLVSDTLLDPNICQLVSSAEMIHPLESALGEGVYPEIIFVYNRVTQSELNDYKLTENLEFLLSTTSGRDPRIKPNFFLVPDAKLISYAKRLADLKRTISKFIRHNRAPHLKDIPFSKIPQRYNAYDWYCNATKVWDSMQHPNYFAAYVKLFP